MNAGEDERVAQQKRMDDIEKEIAKIEQEINNVNQLEKETENEIR